MTTAPSSTMELTETFHHSTALFDFQIRWTALGNVDLPPLVFVHGTPWSSRVWHDFAQRLSRYFRVYLFDNPGFGGSPLGKPICGAEHSITSQIALDGNLAQQSEVFAALYKFWEKDWRGKKAHLVAHDHGGLMSLRAYLLHSCDYQSLCLIDVVAIGPFGHPMFKLVAENEGVFTSLTGPLFDGVVEAYIRDAAYHELDRKTMEMLKRPWIVSDEGKRGFIRQMMQANSRSDAEVEARYHEVGRNIPIRIIWGAEDKWIPIETAWRLKDKLNAKEVVPINGAGHLVMYDQPGKFGTELAWWLAHAS